jgi:secreted trypsin-like serine protease
LFFLKGDSGGPVIMKSSSGRWDLVGITSWGRGCGDIGVYTRVNMYNNWVRQQIIANQN